MLRLESADDELWHVAPRKAPHRASVRGGDPATVSLVAATR
jgi:hypothetical protein